MIAEDDHSEIYKQIAHRERASRKEAERLLEDLSQELYEKKRRVEKTKAMADALNGLLLNVMESSPDGIVTCSQDFKIQSINKKAQKQLGYTTADLKNQSIDLILPGFRQEFDRMPGEEFHFKNMLTECARGPSFQASVRGKRNGNFTKTHFVLFVHDITLELKAQKDLTRHQQQIDEARRLEAIGTLSAGIAHEINTPIQFIGDNLSFLGEALVKIHRSYDKYEGLKSQVETDPNYAQHCEDITAFNQKIGLGATISDVFDCVTESVDGIEQVRDIVLLMKAFVHPGTGGQELTDINSIIEGAVKISRNKFRNVAKACLYLNPNLPKIACRRGQIQQVILNMVMNAVDAIEDEGKGPGLIGLSTRFDDDYIHVTISDTGPGIPEALKEKIFDPFFTTKAVGKGTGQGLALAKDFIVGGHDGQLCFIDIDGYTTTFQISLPRHQSNRLVMETSHAA